MGAKAKKGDLAQKQVKEKNPHKQEPQSRVPQGGGTAGSSVDGQKSGRQILKKKKTKAGAGNRNTGKKGGQFKRIRWEKKPEDGV